jgi:hypothetical protein
MHGTFWRFPRAFSLSHSAGISPRSNYLKVVGDFCRWREFVILGCDDSAKAEFLNTRAFKAKQGSPKQSNSNLWFVCPSELDRFGPAIGRGSVWLRDDVTEGQTSDPYLFSGYDYRQLSLTHQAVRAVTFTLEVDREGSSRWQPLRDITVPPGQAVNHIFGSSDRAVWVRLVSRQSAPGVTAHFQYRNRDRRDTKNDPIFAGITPIGGSAKTRGLMRSLAFDKLGLVTACGELDDEMAYYEVNRSMELVPFNNPAAARDLVLSVQQPRDTIAVDEASVLLIEDGQRYRLPKNDHYVSASAPSSGGRQAKHGFDVARVCREVATERDLLNVHGTFYELPARNAQGVAKIRPIATHNLAIHDFCSHNGLLLFTGLDDTTETAHVFRSADGNAAIWAGVVDDLWKLGKPRGVGGPWHNARVEANQPSDPYLMTGFDKKRVVISSTEPATIRLEVDVDGTGLWVIYQAFGVEPGSSVEHYFPEGFSAYWVRATSSSDTTVSVTFHYQ